MIGISMRELAEKLNVSVASVSVALRGKPGISEETRARILEEAKRLGYDMRRLSTPESKGVIEVIDHTYYNHCDNPQNIPYYTQFLEAVTTTVATHGYALSGPLKPTDPEFASRPKADGSILIGAGITSEELTGYQQSSTPFVVAGNSLPDLPVNTVSHDNYGSILAGISHLTSLGHTHIGYVGSPQGPAGRERLQAYQLGMNSKGLDTDLLFEIPEIISATPGTYSDHLVQCIHNWLNEVIDALPTAFLCDNDFTAAALMRALRSHGQIPGKDVSVIGFDDQPFAALLEPPLTTIHIYESELGNAAVEQLIYNIEHPEAHYRHVKVGTELIIRESVGP